MKSVKIDFVQRKAYPWVWGIAALMACALFAALTVKAHQIKSEKAALAIQVKELQSKRQALQTPSLPPAAALGLERIKIRHANQIAQILQSDIGKALRTLEALKIPAIKLRNLVIDNAQGTIDIDLELANLAQVSVVGESLASGYTKPPWVLISATVQTPSSVVGQPGLASTATPLYLGKWRAKLAEL